MRPRYPGALATTPRLHVRSMRGSLGRMPTPREAVTAPGAPAAVGPYSHAVKTGDLLFCSGQIPLDAGGEIVGDTAPAQAEQCLKNLQAICAAADTTLDRAVKCTVLLTDIREFAGVNEVYARFFEGAEPPARIAYAVAALPKGALVEIDAVVAL
jgi:2-iminobutanoate/2-iminopropanoate deaminase